jgi:hypothetical protein
MGCPTCRGPEFAVELFNQKAFPTARALEVRLQATFEGHLFANYRRSGLFFERDLQSWIYGLCKDDCATSAPAAHARLSLQWETRADPGTYRYWNGPTATLYLPFKVPADLRCSSSYKQSRPQEKATTSPAAINC